MGWPSLCKTRRQNRGCRRLLRAKTPGSKQRGTGLYPKSWQALPHPGRAFRPRDRRRHGRVAVVAVRGRLGLVGVMFPRCRRRPRPAEGLAGRCAGRGAGGSVAGPEMGAGIGTPSEGILSSGSYGEDRRFCRCRRPRHRWIVRRGRLSALRLHRSGRRRRGIDLAGVLVRATRRAAVRSPLPDRRPRWRHAVSGVRCSVRYRAERWRIPRSRS
jgi:hypothetical protein